MKFTRRETLALAIAGVAASTASAVAAPTQISPLSPQSGDGVFLVTGQSQHGFYGDVAQATSAANAYFFDLNTGNWYDCADPLPGWSIPSMSGAGGSIFSRLATQYAGSSYKPWGRLIFVAAAVNSSSSYGWTPAGAHFTQRAVGAYSAMVGRGFTPTAYLWANGEKDNVDMVAGVRLPGDHKAHVISQVDGLRAAGITTPMLMARCCVYRQRITPYANLGPDFNGCTQAERELRLSSEGQIQKEQQWLGANLPAKQAYDGANLDQISAASRWDGGHLDSYGQDVAAQLWLKSILQYKQAGLI